MITQRYSTHRFSRARLYLAHFLVGLTCAATWAQETVDCDSNADLTVGNVVVTRGQVVRVPIIGGSLCEVSGFALAIGYDASRLDFLGGEPGEFLTEYAGSALNVLESGRGTGEGVLTYGVLLDFSEVLEVSPTAIPENTVLGYVKFWVWPDAPYGVAALENKSREYFVNGVPFANIYTTEARQIEPRLASGSVTVSAPQHYSMSLDAVVDTGISLELVGSSSKPLVAFSASLMYDPAVLEVVSDPSTLVEDAFAGTVWEGASLGDVIVGDGTIEVQAARLPPFAPVAAGDGLPFLNLDLGILSCGGDTTIAFEDIGVSTNQFIDDDNFGTHDATTDLVLSDLTIPLTGGAISGFVRGNSNGGPIDPVDPVASVDIADGIYTLHYLFLGGAAPACADAADANDDGRLNLLDPITTFQYLIGNQPTISPPFAQPGEDPTADALGCDSPPGSVCVDL